MNKEKYAHLTQQIISDFGSKENLEKEIEELENDIDQYLQCLQDDF